MVDVRAERFIEKLCELFPQWKSNPREDVRAAETEQQGGDYRKLLGITDSTDKVYAAYLSRLYKLYKERIQF